MFLYDFRRVDAPFDRCAAWFRSSAADTLVAAVTRAFELPALVEPLGATPLRERDDALVLGVVWGGDDPLPWFDRFEGDLQLAPFGPRASHLSVSASYTPTLEVAMSMDVLGFHRETEERIRRCLDAVAGSIEDRSCRSDGSDEIDGRPKP